MRRTIILLLSALALKVAKDLGSYVVGIDGKAFA